MRKLYENFHIFYFPKRIVSAETIHGYMVIEILPYEDFIRFCNK